MSYEREIEDLFGTSTEFLQQKKRGQGISFPCPPKGSIRFLALLYSFTRVTKTGKRALQLFLKDLAPYLSSPLQTQL